MSQHEWDAIQKHRAFMASLSDEETEQYWAERREREALEDAKRARRDHLWRQLGKTLMWLSSIVFAYLLGYSSHSHISPTQSQIAVVVISALFMGGGFLIAAHPHRRDKP